MVIYYILCYFCNTINAVQGSKGIHYCSKCKGRIVDVSNVVVKPLNNAEITQIKHD